jgi:pimeloyl-ACP methyl ester carboxylesterase
MKTRILTLSLLALIAVSCNSDIPQMAPIEADSAPFPTNVDIRSMDGLKINASVYEIGADAPVILLCHQARFNKHEYDGIAEKLNELGFNCIAIDQRSGGPLIEFQNWTNKRALEKDLPVDYLDAEQDIIAAVNYASTTYKKKVILWGSSYSSTLALYVALENDSVSAVISFSPGHYFSPEKGDLIEKLPTLKKPMFVTSSKREEKELSELVAGMEMTDQQIQFVPTSDGYHGSKALWKGQPGGEEYWKAITKFLEELK